MNQLLLNLQMLVLQIQNGAAGISLKIPDYMRIGTTRLNMRIQLLRYGYQKNWRSMIDRNNFLFYRRL